MITRTQWTKEMDTKLLSIISGYEDQDGNIDWKSALKDKQLEKTGWAVNSAKYRFYVLRAAKNQGKFACPVPGCNRRFPSAFGLQIHRGYFHNPDRKKPVKKVLKTKRVKEVVQDTSAYNPPAPGLAALPRIKACPYCGNNISHLLEADQLYSAIQQVQ